MKMFVLVLSLLFSVSALAICDLKPRCKNGVCKKLSRDYAYLEVGKVARLPEQPAYFFGFFGKTDMSVSASRNGAVAGTYFLDKLRSLRFYQSYALGVLSGGAAKTTQYCYVRWATTKKQVLLLDRKSDPRCSFICRKRHYLLTFNPFAKSRK